MSRLRWHRNPRLLPLIALGAAAVVVSTVLIPRLPLLGRLWPLDLAHRPAALVDERLQALRVDQELCRRVLTAPQAIAAPIPDFAGRDDCGWTNGVRLTAAGGASLAVPSATCELAAALALWLAHEVQPQALALLGERVVAVEHRGSFACRNIRGSPANAHRRSEHAGANALDIAALRLASGRRLTLLSHWRGDTPEALFLRDIHRRACRYFRVAIGPDYNAAHRDHLHLDRGRWRACR